MQLVMGGMSQANVINSASQGGSSNWGNGRKKSQNQQPGKSIPTYESGSNLSSNSWQGKGAAWQIGGGFDYERGSAPISADTDAVVLGGETPAMGRLEGSDEQDDNSGAGGMKRVGDRWIWQPS